jgi:hypothetical protein
MTTYIYKDELYHHGIKGQKWGQRRFQYENGTLTPEGRKRYGYFSYVARAERYKNAANSAREKREQASKSLNRNEYLKNTSRQFLNEAASKEYSKAAKAGKRVNAHDMSAARNEALSKYNSEAASVSKTKFMRAYNSSESANYKSLAKVYRDAAKTGRNVLERELIANVKVLSAPYQTIGGRQTTYGKRLVEATLAGAANFVVPGAGLAIGIAQEMAGYKKNRS